METNQAGSETRRDGIGDASVGLSRGQKAARGRTEKGKAGGEVIEILNWTLLILSMPIYGLLIGGLGAGFWLAYKELTGR